jgi:SAM-dependent methyltransferase
MPRPTMNGSFEVNENSDVYYAGTYWNDFEVVRRRINERISGEPTRKWHEHFARTTERTFERALILNCGNGWVERELVEYGLVKEAVGIDYSQSLLDEAAATARQFGLPITYHQANVNTGTFPPDDFDLVVNHAAAHHITAIDRVFREVCRVLPDDGWFVSFDYVGPHRNQYRLDAWEEAWKVNRQLPASLRQDLEYPPIPVMLVVDPTEAVHSELILETFHRYFVAGQCTPLGGAIAYPLLTHNTRMFEADEAARAPWMERILEADDRFLAEHRESTLFAYFAGTPRKSVLRQRHLLAVWEAEEVERERRSREEGGGEYYERGPLATALIALEEQRAEHAAVQARIAELESELQAMRSRYLYVRARRMADADWFRRVRGSRPVVALERRVRGRPTTSR